MFKLFTDYPVQVINWHDRETYPSLHRGKGMFPGVVCGGLQRSRTMELGTPEDVYAEAQDAIKSTRNQSLHLGNRVRAANYHSESEYHGSDTGCKA